MNMSRQVTEVFLKGATGYGGTLGFTAQLYPRPSYWEGFYKGFIIGEYLVDGGISHLGYIGWGDGLGWGHIEVKTNSPWFVKET